MTIKKGLRYYDYCNGRGYSKAQWGLLPPLMMDLWKEITLVDLRIYILCFYIPLQRWKYIYIFLFVSYS